MAGTCRAAVGGFPAKRPVMAANFPVTVAGEGVTPSTIDDRRHAMSDGPTRTPRPPLAGIGKRNIAYLLFVAVLAVPRDRSGLDPAGRGMAEGFMVILWGLVSLPFGLWNLWDLFGAGANSGRCASRAWRCCWS